MLRKLHAAPGVALSIVVVLLALSGAVLALAPVLDRVGAVIPAADQVSVAALAEKVAGQYPGTERIQRKPSGDVIVYYYQDDEPVEIKVDPLTGATIAPYVPSEFFLYMADFHRSFLMGDSAVGRGVAGAGALAMIFLTVSGALLLVARMGGWRMVLHTVHGSIAQQFHVVIGRICIAGLFVAALTGAYMSLTFFEIVPNGMGERPPFPAAVDGGTPAAIGSLAALREVDLGDFSSLVFPFEGDPEDAFELTTSAGAGYVDQASGEVVSWLPHSPARQFYELVLMLHTGQGLWWFGLITGLAALGAPVLATTGTAIWWHQRRVKPRIRRNVSIEDADTVILVGSEGNATWGFAYTLQNELSMAGHFVHLAAMNQLASVHTGDKRMFILTATYGDGSAPESARRFLDQLRKVKAAPRRGVAVLGFGDGEFDHFCQYAKEVQAAIVAKGWPVLAPLGTVNRQSAQEFSRWGEMIGPLIGANLRLVHIAETPHSRSFELVWREDYGDAVQAPTSIMRFAPPPDAKRTLWQRLTGRGRLPQYQAGDLIGVVPPGSNMPRYYSLGSATIDGFLEVSVRKHAMGLCSSYLHALKPGDRIKAFVRPNPEFHLRPGKSPVVMMGAGCGVGPLAGFVRANRLMRPMRLYFGARDPASDFLYQNEMKNWLAEGKLSALVTAFSRSDDRSYLQDKVVADADILRGLIEAGAQIMVVGGREMAEGVLAAIDQVLAPTGRTAASLKAEGRYVEDIY